MADQSILKSAVLPASPMPLLFQTGYDAVLHHLHYHPDLKTYALYHLHDRMFLKLKQGCHSPSFPLTSKLQLNNFPILIYDSFLRRHWIFLTRSMMSSSTWWDQTSILLLPSLIWLTCLTITIITITIKIIMMIKFRWITFCGIQKRAKDVSSEEVYSLLSFLAPIGALSLQCVTFFQQRSWTANPINFFFREKNMNNFEGGITLSWNL